MLLLFTKVPSVKVWFYWMWMYNQCRVSASSLAVDDLRTQLEINCRQPISLEKGFAKQNLSHTGEIEALLQSKEHTVLEGTSAALWQNYYLTLALVRSHKLWYSNPTFEKKTILHNEKQHLDDEFDPTNNKKGSGSDQSEIPGSGSVTLAL